MDSNTVGSVKYDASIDLAGLKASLAQAEKLLKEHDRKQKNSNKKSTPRSSPNGSTASEAQARIAAVKEEAAATSQAISSYTPKLQAHYLAVERANLRVETASRRASDMIQKYGASSTQAQNATVSLTNALYSQTNAQNRLDQARSSGTTGLKSSTVAMTALKTAAIAAGAAIALNMGNAVRRLDTMNNFPKVMQNFGISAADGQAAIEVLSNELIGLPTSLDAAAQAVQRFTAVNGNVKASTALFLAVNNAIIAGAAPMDLQRTALEQLSQAYSKGRFDMVEWRSLLAAIPGQLNQVAGSMGITTDALGEGLRSGKISIDDFMKAIVDLNQNGANGFNSFKDQAKNAVGGVEVTLTNLQTAISRSIAGALSAIGTANIQSIIGAIASAFEAFGRGVSVVAYLLREYPALLWAVGAGFVALGVAMVAIKVAALVASTGMGVFGATLTVITAHPIILTLTVIAGLLLAVGAAAGVVSKKTDKSTSSVEDMNKAFNNMTPPIRAATEEAGKLGKQMAKLAEQANKIREDYRYSLAELVADKNKNIATLQDTLKSEKTAYDNSYKERLASFNKTQNDEQVSHQKKTAALQQQIDFLSKYNTAANRKQLSELQFALARENSEHQKATQLRKDEFDAETQSQLAEFEKRRQATQSQLDADLELLNKHKDDVASIRGIMLRDQIQNLQYQRDEQLKSLKEQEKNAQTSAATTAQNVLQEFNKNNPAFGKAGEDFGAAFGKGLNNYAIESLKDLNRKIKEPLKRLNDAIQKPAEKGWNALVNALDSFERALGGQKFNGSLEDYKKSIGRYKGGNVSASQPYLVGENRDGSINPTTELFVPNTTGRIINSADLQEALAGKSGGGTVVTVNLSMSGVMTSSKSDERSIATRMAKLINETVKANTGTVAIQGV